ncbi:MAG: hypothetical protein ACI9SE_002099 [Neolewinella sp.]|jgi:hypothetical protein
MQHTLPLHTLPTGLRGDLLGVRFLSIRAAIVGLFPFVNFHNPQHDPRSHARTRCQHTAVRHQVLSWSNGDRVLVDERLGGLLRSYCRAANPFASRIKSRPTCRQGQTGCSPWPRTRTQMEITNKTRRPIKVPLPEGKKLFLGPSKSGQVHPKAANHPPVKELLEAGDLELGKDDKKGSTSSDGSSSSSGNQNSGPTGNIRRTGDR